MSKEDGGKMIKEAKRELKLNLKVIEVKSKGKFNKFFKKPLKGGLYA